MKSYLPVLFLLFVYTLCLNKDSAAQDTAAIEVNTDTTEEIVIACSFPSIDAEYPGGEPAWQRFLTRHLVYPKKAKRKKIEGIVTVGIVISKDGFVTEVNVISGPKELRQSAIDVVMKSPKWSPAIQDGRHVKAYKKSDIVFKLKKE